MDDKVNFADGEPRDANLASKELDSSNVSVHSPDTSDTERRENEANPFKDPKTLAHWQKVHVCLWACIMFFALQTDRGNLSQAVSDNMLKELHLSTDDYNTGNTINLVAFLCAEVPSQLISKKVGPDRWIPTQMVLWSIVAGSQAAMQGKAGFYTTRVLLGVLQGGFIPDLVLWLSYFYKSNDDFVGERSLIASLQNVWVLPCLIALHVWSGTEENAWGTFALITVLLSYPYCHAILVAWASRNSGSVRTRSVSAAAYNMMVQLGNIVAANIYRSNDAPVYRTGNTVLIVIDVVSILMFPATKLYYIWRNKRRERVWNGMSEEERRAHLENLGDSGSKRLVFRFVH
ncbi:hypothetical protein PRZ48_000066 [Zasmidium cellare]|uniref:Allantoate permease n=1 Tax=Zasmidium cellare TaxID=395010 RepID=A0ABR0EYU0_ZASCE|nr:hypothetical protein PRZ48_000066 [Zasmidium cellare]